MSDIQPADVYQRVNELHDAVRLLQLSVKWLIWISLALGFLFVVDIALKGVMNYRIGRLLGRTEKLATVAEHHGALTDDKVNELKKTTVAVEQKLTAQVRAATAEVTQVVPPKTAEEVKKLQNPPSGDGDIPTVKG